MEEGNGLAHQAKHRALFDGSSDARSPLHQVEDKGHLESGLVMNSSTPGSMRPEKGFPLFSFAALADISTDERLALESVSNEPVAYRRGEIIRRQRDASPKMFLIHKGWAATRATLRNGARQYFKIHCAGDVMGASSLPFECAAETLIVLSDAKISVVSPRRLSALFAARPRLAMLFFLMAQVERTNLMDHITALGRCSAEQRVAGFLVHVAEKAKAAGLHCGSAFEFPLTQRQIGDVLGLTPVHVNRVLRSFDQRGHIERHRKWIEILRADDLRSISGLMPHVVVRNADWLPKT